MCAMMYFRAFFYFLWNRYQDIRLVVHTPNFEILTQNRTVGAVVVTLPMCLFDDVLRTSIVTFLTREIAQVRHL